MKTKKQRAAIDHLPPDAIANDVWTRVVIPSFVKLILSGDNPWASSEADVAPLLQNVWDHTYGSRVPLKIERGMVALNLVCPHRIAGHTLMFSSFRLFRNYANTVMLLRRKPYRLSTAISSRMLTLSLNQMPSWSSSQSLLNISSKVTISSTKGPKIPQRQVKHDFAHVAPAFEFQLICFSDSRSAQGHSGTRLFCKPCRHIFRSSLSLRLHPQRELFSDNRTAVLPLQLLR